MIETNDLQNVNVDEDTKLSMKNFLTKCYLNIALTTYRMKDYNQSISACNEVTQLEPSNVKALYRRAKARLAPTSVSAESQKIALKELKLASTLDTSLPEIAKEYSRFSREVKQQLKKEKSIYGGFLNRSKHVIYDSSERQLRKDEPCKLKSIENLIHQAESVLHHKRNLDKNDEKIKSIENWVDNARKACKTREKPSICNESFDFQNPSQDMIDEAQKFGIDLDDERVVELLEEMQVKLRSSHHKIAHNNKRNYLGRITTVLPQATDFTKIYKRIATCSTRDYLIYSLRLIKFILLAVATGRFLEMIFRILSDDKEEL